MSWWNPGTWWNDATKAASGITSQIQSWVLTSIQSAVSLIDQDLHDLAQWAQTGLDQVGDWAAASLETAARDIDHGIEYAFTEATNAIETVNHEVGVGLSEAERGIAQAVNQARQWADDAISEAEQGISTAEGVARSLVGTVEHDLIVGLDDAARSLGSAVSDVESWAAHEIGVAAGDVYRLVQDDLIAPLLDIIHLAEKCAGWLEWLAANPIELFVDAETGVVDWAKGLPADALGALRSHSFDGTVETITQGLGI